MNKTLFGTDGIRGPYGSALINESFAFNLGKAAATWLLTYNSSKQIRVVLGRDTRKSGICLVQALADGFKAKGVEVEDLGVVPTPLIARIVRDENLMLGIMVTASHNPASDNGFKCLGFGGRKLTDEQEKDLAHILAVLLSDSENKYVSNLVSSANYTLNLTRFTDAYFEALKSVVAGHLKGWIVCVDTANGATWQTTPLILRDLGAKVIGLGDNPDGTNINFECGSEYPQQLQQAVVKAHAQLGIAHDGDGDRCILFDELGHSLDGDEILAILGMHLLSENKLSKKTLIATVHSNLGLDLAIKQAGGKVIRTPVGDRHVAEAMQREGSALGGESSGHIISPALGPTGDGAAAALHVIAVMKKTGKKLSELRMVMNKLPQAYIALPVKVKKPLSELKRLEQCIKALEVRLGDEGLVLVRFSGTEDKLRLMVQAKDPLQAEAGLKALVAAANEDLA